MRAVELPTGQAYHHRILSFNRRSLLDRGFYFGNGFHAIYLTRALPGRQYTLGFRYAASWLKQVKVMLFDRWPYAPGARQFDLPRAPLLRGRSDQVEFRWHLSISPESSGSLLYIVVEAADTNSHRHHGSGFPHDLFLAWPPIESRNEIGHGVTYLQGPENLLLAEQDPVVPMVLTDIDDGKTGYSSLPAWETPHDLVVNGSFTNGMQHWSSIQNSAQSKQHLGALSVSRDGLVLRATANNANAGVQQQLEVDVRDAAKLLLQARVRIVSQTEPGLGEKGNVSPLSISVCYDDVTGTSHCSDQAYTHRFYSLKSNSQKREPNGEWIPEGDWFWFSEDLMRLTPKPVHIRSISLQGSGRPKWQSSIREIHLIKRGEPHEQDKD
jgi:hypothetical protein